ncbi:MAG: hypothetical protein JSU73_00715 [candidate division WOR-3 bacterium]|nr:MAG: hypothetical protein JSU73_00715 [candidate division WOR-3 bacterium]
MSFLLAALLLAQAPAGDEPAAAAETTATAAKSPDAHGLGEEVITGQVDVKIDDAKYFFAPQVNPFAPIDDLLAPESYVFDEALYRSVDSMTVPHHFVRSSYLRVPVERDFIYDDIMVFLPSFESRVATWELVVSNSLGETVRRVVRKGQPPALISWDGRTDDGEAIVTGEIYSFTFNAYDAQGNQTRIPGSPQRINAMVFEQEDEWVVSIAADQIFAGGTVTLVEGAPPRLDEAANIVKERFRKEVVIYVYTEQEKLSSDRCAVIKGEMRRRIVLPEEAVKVAPRFVPGLKPKFSKIEIHVL